MQLENVTQISKRIARNAVCKNDLLNVFKIYFSSSQIDGEASNSPSEMRMKKPSGIPMEHMLFVNEPLPGTYKTHTGQYAVPKIDA